MTLYEFNTLPYERQLVLVFAEATFLAQRWSYLGLTLRKSLDCIARLLSLTVSNLLL